MKCSILLKTRCIQIHGIKTQKGEQSEILNHRVGSYLKLNNKVNPLERNEWQQEYTTSFLSNPSPRWDVHSTHFTKCRVTALQLRTGLEMRRCSELQKNKNAEGNKLNRHISFKKLLTVCKLLTHESCFMGIETATYTLQSRSSIMYWFLNKSAFTYQYINYR